jgi:sugar lactone lactonase YvrE
VVIRSLVAGAVALVLSSGLAVAAPNEITLPGAAVFPESITATRNGDLFIDSVGNGAVYRVAAGTQEPVLWLDPAKTGMRAAFGLLADERSNTLFLCSITPRGAPAQPELANLRTFDLKTGAARASYPLPAAASAICNDIAIGADGAAYVTDTGNASVLRLRPGAASLEVWVKDERLISVDGLAFGASGDLYVNTVRTNRLFRIGKTAAGSAGPITELTPSMSLKGPDGLRPLDGERFLMAENSATEGRVTVVTVEGDKARLDVLVEKPSVTSMAVVGQKIWVTNAMSPYWPGNPKAGQPTGPFVVFAIARP